MMMNLKLFELQVLYVEDEKSVRDQTQMILRDFVKEVHLASNGEEGLRLALEKEIDIIVTDILMPGMNGIDMLSVPGQVKMGSKYAEFNVSEAEFYQLMDELLHDPACKFCDVVHDMVRGRAETAEAKERELAEEEALLKAMQRGELPQGDE